MMAEQIAFVGHLSYRFRNLLPLVEEHLEDQEGMILPHLIMADICRWILSRFIEHGRSETEVREILSELEDAYTSGGQQIRELIVASFLENLPRSGEKGVEIRELLGPKLQEHLARIG